MAEILDCDQKPRPHAVLVPLPAQGHINPLMKVAKILHHRGFHITFVNTEFNHRRLLRSQGSDALNSIPTFQFAAIPDGIPCSDEDATQDPFAIVRAIMTNLLTPFRELVLRLNDTAVSNVPPVTCIISGGNMSFTLDVAQELGIPNVILWTLSACGLLVHAHFRQLIQEGFVPFKDSNFLTDGTLDTIIDWIPGMKGVKLKDLTTLIRTTDPDNIMVHFNIGEVERGKRASANLVNTFDELDLEVLEQLKCILPNVLAIGPLHLLENQLPADSQTKSVGSNLWKDDSGYLEWLDSKEPNSVIYVNFGSMARMTAEQLVELAWGLANSKQNFLWIIRSDIVADGSGILSPEIRSEIKNRGLLASWCNQEKVLNHPAIGGHLTHCGWNSMLESIAAGVPMICCPAVAEQPTNSWFCCNKWGIGLELNSDLKRNEVEKLVRELMIGEIGKWMKEKALDWKKMAEKACSTGSTFANIEKMVNDVLLSKSQA